MTRRRQQMATRLGILVLCALVLIAAGGCKKGTGIVFGKVMRTDGKVVESGNIIFYTKDGRSASAVLKKDGTYRMGDAPVGEVKVVIQPPPQRMGMMSRGPDKRPAGMSGMPTEFAPQGAAGDDEPGAIVAVNKKYENKDETPLEYTVEKGEHEQDFTVAPP